MKPLELKPLELWGGPECTVNRVGDGFADQLRLTGHHDRADDLDHIAALGLTAIRYPVLWERVSPDAPHDRDWRWSDERLIGLRDRGIRPIVGLTHHGSGPHYSNLLADNFAAGLALHAGATAERYPWVRDWTPVNEPCTTARFACLYGHWYPHHRTEGSFWRALVNQIDAIRLSMRAIRAVNPTARLIQTDDLGRTYATVAVRDQAAFDNARRWMGWDLLVGRVVPGHPLWDRLCRIGLGDRLRAIADDPCPPDVVGINHYLTSDRFLDHRVRRYPWQQQGGNGARRFADTEAIRVLQPPPAGIAGVLREAWERYGIPVAVTEAHNGSTREEQMRWMADAWHAAKRLRGEGVAVEAVTSWALFGSAGWNTLLTDAGLYEPGAYDVSAGTPRPTAMVRLLQSLAAGKPPSHPVLSGDGWWRRDIRLHHPIVPRPAPVREHLRGSMLAPDRAAQPVLIAGATGTLGQALAAACRHRHIAYVLTARTELDLNDEPSIQRALDQHRPWCVINAAGWVRVDEAEAEAAACIDANAAGAIRLAEACASRGIATVAFSSDLVFDGTLARSCVESDVPAPLNVYGRSKALAEARIGALAGTHLIVRTAAFFSPFDPFNFAVQAVATLLAGGRFGAAHDQIVSPTYVPDLCNAVLDLAIDGEAGIWHLTNGAPITWDAFARRLAESCGLDPGLVEPRAGRDLGWVAPRPPYVALASNRGRLMPSLESAIQRFAEEHRKLAQLHGRAAA